MITTQDLARAKRDFDGDVQLYRNHLILVGYDDCSPNPIKDWCMDVKFAGTLHIFNIETRNAIETMADLLGVEYTGNNDKTILNAFGRKYIYQWIDKYEHSGVKLTAVPQPTRRGFDSGIVGIVYVEKSIIKDYLKKQQKRSVKRQSVKEYGKDMIEDAMDSVNTWLSGEVRYYKIIDEDSNEINSCYGFYDEEQATEDAKDMIDVAVNALKKKQAARLKEQIKHRAPLQKRFPILTY